MKNREVLLVLFLSIATFGEGQRERPFGSNTDQYANKAKSYGEDGKYYPVGDDGQYHPRGDDGQYHPTDEGRYIPDYSGLYHPSNEEEYDRTQSRGNQYTTGAKYTLGTGTVTLGYKPGINVQAPISPLFRPARPVASRPKYATGNDNSKLSSTTGQIGSAPRPASFSSKYEVGRQIPTFPTSFGLNKPSSKVSTSNFAPKYESIPTVSGSSSKFPLFSSTSSGINKDKLGGKVSVIAPVSNVGGLTSKVSAFPSASSVLPAGSASFGTNNKYSPLIFGAHTVSSALPTRPENFQTNIKYPTISSSVFGSKTEVKENISPFPLNRPSTKFSSFPSASSEITSTISGKVSSFSPVFTDSKFTGRLSASHAASSAFPTNFGSFRTGNGFPTSSSSSFESKTETKNNISPYPPSVNKPNTRFSTFPSTSSVSTSQIGGKISTFSSDLSNSQFTGKLSAHHTVSSALPSSPGNFGADNKNPGSYSSGFGSRSGINDKTLPFPTRTSISGPSIKFPILPSAPSGLNPTVGGKLSIFSSNSNSNLITNKVPVIASTSSAFPASSKISTPSSKSSVNIAPVFQPQFGTAGRISSYPSNSGVSKASNKFPTLPSAPLGNYQSVDGRASLFAERGESKTGLPVVSHAVYPAITKTNQPNKFSVNYHPITSENKVTGSGGPNGKFITSNLSVSKPLVDNVNSQFYVSSGTTESKGKLSGFVPLFTQDRPEIKPKSFSGSQNKYPGVSFITPVSKPELKNKSKSSFTASISKTNGNFSSVTSSPYVSKYNNNEQISALPTRFGNKDSNGELTAHNAFGSKPTSLFPSTLSKLPGTYDLQKPNVPRVTTIPSAAQLKYEKNDTFEKSFTSISHAPKSDLSGPNSDHVEKFSISPERSQTKGLGDKLTPTSSISYKPNSSLRSKTLSSFANVGKFPVVSPIYSAQDQNAEFLNLNKSFGISKFSEKLSISSPVSTVFKPQINDFNNNKPNSKLSNIPSVFTTNFNANIASLPTTTAGSTLSDRLPVSSHISTVSKLSADKSALALPTSIKKATKESSSFEFKPFSDKQFTASPDSVSYTPSGKVSEFSSHFLNSKPQSVSEKLTVFPTTIKSDRLTNQLTASFVPQPKLSETVSAFPTGFGTGSPSNRVSPFSTVSSKPKVELGTTLSHPSVGSVLNLPAFRPTSSGLKYGSEVKQPTYVTNLETRAPNPLPGVSSISSGNKAGLPLLSEVGKVSNKLPLSRPISYGGQVEVTGSKTPVFSQISATGVTSSKLPVFSPVSSKSDFSLNGKASTFASPSTSKLPFSSTSPAFVSLKPITTDNVRPRITAQYSAQNQGRYSPNGSAKDTQGQLRPTGNQYKPKTFGAEGSGQYSSLRNQYKPTGLDNGRNGQYNPSEEGQYKPTGLKNNEAGQYRPTGVGDGKTSQYNPSSQGQYKPTGFGVSGQGQYRLPEEQSKLTGFGAGRDSSYRSSSGGQYVHDNSGNGGGKSGQYVPDDSGSYVHIDSKYLHDDVAGGHYTHQQEGIDRYRPDKSAGGQYKPDKSDNGGYTPDKNSQSGYKPYKDDQGGYKPDKDGQDGYKPYNDGQGGYTPYNDKQDNYRPNKENQGSYRPDKNNEGGYKPDGRDNYRLDKSPGSKKPLPTSDSGFGKDNIRPISSGTGSGAKPSIVPSEYEPLEGAKLGSDICSYESLRNYKIIRQKGELHQDNYHYLYETENCMYGEERGEVHNKGREDEVMRADGIFYYVGPDKVKYTVTYTANENGFVPHGAHLPTPPPIPAAILRSLEYQRSKGVL